MNALDAIRADMAELRDALAGINARREQIVPEINEHHQAIVALEEERRKCLHDSEQAAMAIARLERAEALLIEHEAPEEPVDADHKRAERMARRDERRARQREEHMADLRSREPGAKAAARPAPSPNRQRIRDELDAAARARHEAEERDRLPAGEAPTPKRARRDRLDPLRVPPAGARSGMVSPKSVYRVIEEGAHPEIDINDLSAVMRERSDLLYDAVVDAGGHMAQCDMNTTLAYLLECNPNTAQACVSRCLAVLYRQGRIVNTGLKGEDAAGRASSPIWKIKEQQS